MSTLSDLLNGGTVSARQAAERASNKGIKLPYGTLAGYWAGRHGKPSAATLKKLAQVVPFTEKQLQEAAWGTSSDLGPYIPPEESVLLNERQRRSLDELIKSIVKPQEESHATQPADTAVPSPPESGTQAEGQGKKSNVHDLIRRDQPRRVEEPGDAWAARHRDPRFPPEDPDADGNDIGEENQDE